MKTIANLAAALLLATASFAADVPAPAPPAEGTAAPKFDLPSQDSPSVSLDEFKGKWVVLYFYPKDFTSGCTLEAHNFQRDLAKYEAKNAVIIGVSEDNVESHKGFCTKEELSFKVLADTADHNVATAYGSLMMHEGTAYASRNTFLIDPNGVIRKVYLKVKPATHSDEVLADLESNESMRAGKGSLWEREPVLTNDAVLSLLKADLGDEIVIAKIKNASRARLDVSTDALVILKKARVSSPVLAAMIERAARPSASASTTSADNAQTKPPATPPKAPSNPCADIELMGLLKEDMRPMSPLIIYIAQARNASNVAKIVRLQWLDMYGQAMQSTVQIGGGQIAKVQLAAQEPFQRQPVELRIASCQ